MSSPRLENEYLKLRIEIPSDFTMIISVSSNLQMGMLSHKTRMESCHNLK